MENEFDRIISLEEWELVEAMENYEGYCLACGNSQGGVEPDAQKYQCETCKCFAVYGTEELLLMGKIEIVGESEED